MRELAGKVAVVTGAASGIGRALAGRLAREGMKVVLADVEQDALARVEADLRATGATVHAVVTDVSDGAAVEALAQATLRTFGAVHLVCNNAGVLTTGRTWEHTTDDWAWVLGVNLWGVIHGIRVFVPILLAQQTEGHIVNTASVNGLIPMEWAPYDASKAAVIAISEDLALNLAQVGAPVKVSVLCPGGVHTKIADAARNRPAHLGQAGPVSPSEVEWLRAAVAAATPPEQIADEVVTAVREERFYILPHPGYKALVRERMEGIVAERYPEPPAIEALTAAQSAR